ncbi:MAG TPA: alpha/beta hydrolase [Chthonomonadaceae bacterium]|nr:alpha/beta hydrolase [Chthonomonadaceae bacterium]
MKPIPLWPGAAPGDKDDIGEEKDTSPANEDRASKSYVIRLGSVSQPTITVYPAPAEKRTGAAVVVCPGGGYSILAMNLEGTEVCDWLNSIGVTAVLLKYRVPARRDRERYAAPLQDAQRALGLVRFHAKEWEVDPARVGILGFSAGGHLSATTCASAAERTYPAVDEADKESCRPSFCILIYPAYLATDDNAHLAPEIKVTADTPPTFITMTQDDPVHVEGALLYALALKKAKVPFELHVYPKGGHGYGLRHSENLVSQWPARAEGWLRTQGWLKPR